MIDVLSEGKEVLVTNALDEITLLGGTANKLGTYHVSPLTNELNKELSQFLR